MKMTRVTTVTQFTLPVVRTVLVLAAKPFRTQCLFYTPNRGVGSLLLHNGRFREGVGLGQRAAAGERLKDLNFQAKWANREHVLVAQHGALDALPI